MNMNPPSMMKQPQPIVPDAFQGSLSGFSRVVGHLFSHLIVSLLWNNSSCCDGFLAVTSSLRRLTSLKP
jgi:hypothetical protein